MSEYSRAQTIDHYFNLIDSGQMEFSSLRKQLEEKNIPKVEINVVVRQVDKQLVRSTQKKADHSVGKNLFIGGLCLSGLGILLTVGTYSSFIDIGNVYLVAYGPIIGGLIIAITGKSKMK